MAGVVRHPGDSRGVALTGLSGPEARRRLALGRNVLVPTGRSSFWARWVKPLADPMALLLLIAAPVYLAIGDTVDAAVTAVALVPIIAVGWVLEARAERALQRLRALTAPTVLVRRDGRDQSVNAEEVVPGDLMLLREGDIVPADGRVVEGTQLMLDEAALTGESLPVAKSTVAGSEAVYAGTTVLSGRGLVEVDVTGVATRYGQIGRLVAQARQPATPLQRLVSRLVRRFGAGAAAFCVAVLGVQLLQGAGWGPAIIAAVSLAIAAVPEEFPMVYTLYLAVGAWQLARDRALIRRLPAVETLGSTSLICTDKTGTLTEGKVRLTAVTDAAGRVAGDEPQPAHRAVLEAAVLASEPDPFDPVDRAVLAYATEAGVDVDALHAGHLAVDNPFDPVDKYLSHVWRLPGEKGCRICAKGSLEGILVHCGADVATRTAAERANRRLAEAGMRVIAVGAGQLDASDGDRAVDERALRFVGLIAFSDPIRAGVADALSTCRSAGIRVVMITGDHPVTAHAIAEGLGLPHEDDTGANVIVTGDQLDAADDAALHALCATANVFARSRPEQKHRLVRAFRDQGHVVAMTGDGINDAPALREADIGVAMGERGTEVARGAATMVLLDDNFATIVGAVRRGRHIFDNLTRSFAYLVAFHPPLLLAALIVPLAGKPLLLLPVQLILLELVMHPVVSLVFQADPPAPDLLTRPPRPRDRGLGGRELVPSLARGLSLGLVVTAYYLVLLATDHPAAQARGLAFAALLVGQLILVFVERSPDAPLWRGPRPSRASLAAGAAVLAIILAGAYAPPVRSLLHLAAFPAGDWLAVLAVAGVATLWTEPVKSRWAARARPR